MITKRVSRKLLMQILASLLAFAMVITSLPAAGVRADEENVTANAEAVAPTEAGISAKFGTPLVDGVAEDIWADVQAYRPAQTRNNPDSDVTFKVMWDDNALYVLAEVTDETLDDSSANNYEQDSIELFLDEVNDRQGAYGSDDLHYRVNYNNVRSADSGDSSRWYSKTAVTETGFIAEVCIRWDNSIAVPANGSRYGFDAQLNCAKGGSRVGELSLFATSGDGYQNTSLFGEVVLDGKAEGQTSGAFPYDLMSYLEEISAIDSKLFTNGDTLVAAIAEAEILLAGGVYTVEKIGAMLAKLKEVVLNLDDGTGFTAPEKLPENPELPDIFTFFDGETKVTADNWAQRKAEIKAYYDYYMYGPMPDTSNEVVTYEVENMVEKTVTVKDPVTGIKSDIVVNEGTLTVTVTEGEKSGSFSMVFVVPTCEAPAGGYPFYSEMSGYAGDTVYYAASRGMACASWTYTDIASDDLSRGGLFYKIHPYGASWTEQTGALVAWGWGAGKILDALDAGLAKYYNINAEINMLAGVSRLGKATAVAGAYDERIKYVDPTCSGAGGLATYRYSSEGKTYDGTNAGLNHDGNTKVTVDQNEGLGSLQASGEIFWFNDHFAKFSSVNQLPVDQYFLAALMADENRYLMITGGFNGENWTNPAAMSLTYLKAREVYDMLGLRDHLFINIHETNESGSTPNHKIIPMDLAYFIDVMYENEYGADPASLTTDRRKIKSCLFFEDVNRDPAWDSLIGNNVTGVDSAKFTKSAITLDYGADKAAVMAALPSTGYVYVDEARYASCAIKWNPESIDFDAETVNQQEITAAGTLVLPEGVVNDTYDLSIEAKVIVRAKPDDLYFTAEGATEAAWAQANTYAVDRLVSGATSAEASVSVMYDTANLYISADVKDSVLYTATDTDSDKEDSITLYIASGINDGADVRKIILTADGHAVTEDNTCDLDWSTFAAFLRTTYNPIDAIDVSAEATAEGYRLTAVIPFASLNLATDNTTLAFETVLADYDANGASAGQKTAFIDSLPEHEATASYMGWWTVTYNAGLYAEDLHAANMKASVPYSFIVADGVTEEAWNNIPAFTADNLLDEAAASSDGTAKIKFAWDDAYLYVLADVNDSDVYTVADATDAEDSITLSVAAGDEVKNLVITADGQLANYAWSGDLSMSTFAGYAFKTFNAAPGYAAAGRSASGWNVEAAVAWSSLGIEMTNDTEIGLEAVVNSCSSASKGMDYRKAVFAQEYPVNNMTVSGNWYGFFPWSATYNAGFAADDLADVLFTAKTTDTVISDIGRYELLVYISSYEADNIDPYPVKDSFDAELLVDARDYAASAEATAEGILEQKQILEDMAKAVFDDNYQGKLMVKSGTPLVDGVADDAVWENAYSYKTGVDGAGQYADIKALWDSEAVYFLVNVHDPSYDVAGSDAHQKDSVEFFFIPEDDAANNSFGRDGGQWRINRANVVTVTFGDNEPFYAKLNEVEGGYVVEARYEFADSMNIGPESVLNLDIAVNLCENGARTAAVAWASGDCYSNPKTSGQMIFLETSAGESSMEVGYNPYVLFKLLDKALAMKEEDYDAASFNANYDKARLQAIYDEAAAGGLSKKTIDKYYAEAIEMMSKITYDGVHKSVLGFKENADYPDVFTMNDGTKVQNDALWTLRHEEIQDLYEFYMYGKLPKAEETGLKKEFAYDSASGKYTITVSREGIEPASFTFSVYMPEGESQEGGFPYIINYGGNISGAQDAGLAVIDYSAYGDVASNDSYYNGVFYKMYPECKGNDYVNGVGPLAARAWGAGLIIDCIEAGVGELCKLNPKLSAVTGFSFLGKTALVTGVLEDRILVTNPEHSGIGGAAPFRYSAQGKMYTAEDYGFERDHLVTKIEPIGQVQGQGMAWVKTIFADFLGGDCTPFDTYMLLSLVAPRGLFVSGGYYDNGTNPEGMYAAYVQAKKVYDFLGISDKIAFGDYPTDHASSDAENNDLFAFCNYIFYGQELPEGFYNTVFDNSPDRAEYDVITVPARIAEPSDKPADSHSDYVPVVLPASEPETSGAAEVIETGDTKTPEGAADVIEATAVTKDGKTVYEDKNGNIIRNSYIVIKDKSGKPMTCFVKSNGKLLKNTVKVLADGSRIIADKDGRIVESGLVKTSKGKLVYVADGKVVTKKWVTIDGIRYYFNSKGKCTKQKKSED